MSHVFTPDEVAAMISLQYSGRIPPLTCPNHDDGKHRNGVLVPTVRGWVCPFCNYTSRIPHEYMKEEHQKVLRPDLKLDREKG